MSERNIRLYLMDIIDSGNAIMEYVKGMSFDDFCNDRKTYSAVVREFENDFDKEVKKAVGSKKRN
ncbi:MAG: hypothetical protein HYV59_11455 [Planctomycetes bacterium]|nr:hypothetical protein [Planctomycetota bacterium]